MLHEKSLTQKFPFIIVFTGAVGLLMSFLLTLEKLQLLADKDYIPPCDINPLISCGSVIGSPQASVFGFPNPLLGLIGFAIVVTIGMALISGGKFKKWFWLGYQAGILFAISFIHWLFYQAVYNLGALCPNCIVVWSVTIPLFFYSLLYGFTHGHFGKNSKHEEIATFMWANQFTLITAWYLSLFALIVHRFWFFFSGLFA